MDSVEVADTVASTGTPSSLSSNQQQRVNEIAANASAELRFTRNQQALMPVLLALLCFLGAVFCCFYGIMNAEWGIAHEWKWFAAGFLLIALSVGLFMFAYRCLRHAYLILSPVGIEVFPLWKVDQHFRVFHWSEIKALYFDDAVIKIDLKQGGGAVLTFAPLAEKAKKMAQQALACRAKELQILLEEKTM